MWEEGEFHRNQMKLSEECNRLNAEKRRQDAAEEDRRRRNEEGRRWVEENIHRNNNTQNDSGGYSSYSKPKDDGYVQYTFTMPSSSHRSSRSIITSIIGAVILGGVFGYIFGLFGFIGGAVGGWFLGGIIGKKFFIALVILGVLGGGLYMARSYIAPLFSSITGKAIPLSGNATTITGNVNFRTEPSLDSAIIKTLQQGDTVTSTGEVSGGWTQVRHNGDTGWVSSEYVKQ